MSHHHVASQLQPDLIPLALATGRGDPARLPAPLSSLVGREREIAAVGALVSAPAVRLVTLVGPGGIGKSRVALAVAAECGEIFADGVAFVALAEITQPDLVLRAIAQALGFRVSGSRPLADLLALALRTARCLIVLDNVEQERRASPALANLLVSCPGLTALATSRERLRLSGEHVFEVPPLPVHGGSVPPRAGAAAAGDGAGDRTIEDAADAVTLFVQRAREAAPGFVFSGDDRSAVIEICVRLDGRPLAIELAAARVALLPPPALLPRLDRRLPLLTGDRGTSRSDSGRCGT